MEYRKSTWKGYNCFLSKKEKATTVSNADKKFVLPSPDGGVYPS